MTRSVVITGASSGIGLACVEAFLSQGDRVVGLSRSEVQPNVDEEALTRLETFVVDISDEHSVRRIFDQLHAIDVLVLNAGTCDPVALGAAAFMPSLRTTLDINLVAPFHCLHAALPHLRESASVVMVSSGLGKLGRAGYAAYSASKHGLLGLMRSAALELAPSAIRVNAVCPGWVDTPMADNDIRRTARQQGRSPLIERAHIENALPLGRLVRPTEVAGLIRWLSSEEAMSITGQAYNIASGEFSQ